MNDPIITCPNCHTAIHLTESLAAPLLAATRQQFQQQLAQKDEAISQREQAIRQQEQLLSETKRNVDQQVTDQVTVQLKIERDRLIADEAKKAKLAVASELENNLRELANLKELLQTREQKLSEAQAAQVDLLKKQRELDDTKRELELTIEKRVQQNLTMIRDQARQEAEEGLKLKVMEKD